MASTATRARRTPVPALEPLVDRTDHGYADAFEIELHEGDRRTAEELARSGLGGAPPAVRWLIRNIHRHVLRFRVDTASPSDILGWRVTASTPDAVRLQAAGPLIDATIIVRRISPSTVRLTTYIFYNHPAAKPIIERAVSPVHRRVAREILQRTARGNRDAGATTTRPPAGRL